MNANQKDVLAWSRAAEAVVRDTPGFPPHEILKLGRSILWEELHELDDAIILGDIVGVADALADIEVTLHQMSLRFGIDTQPVFEEVMRTNWEKFPGGKVIRRKDGKILKPDGWQPPDIKAVLERQGPLCF